MATPAWRSRTAYGAYEVYDADDDLGELSPGDRLGPPLVRTGRRALLRGGIIILFVVGIGWPLLGERATQPEWWLSKIATVSAAIDAKLQEPLERPARASTALPSTVVTTNPTAFDARVPASPPPTSSREPPAAPARPEAPPGTAALPPAAATEEEPAAEPLPPPTVDPTDPYQVRASAVGLHPDLSRVLLARLSATDYRNAGVAIDTAIAETPDNAVFVWPRQRKPELALFQVRFVAGAATGCRRYVVSVTKDGWLTTAPPMERCGTQANRARRG